MLNVELAKLSHLYINKKLPYPIHNFFTKSEEIHSYNTRSKTFPIVVKHKSNIFAKSFICKIPTVWHSISAEIRSTSKYNTFCYKYKKFILSQYD